MMIEGSKQQQLTFDKGITNVPSDAICSDNALAESVGMVYDDGEHRVIQKPEVFVNTGDYYGQTSAAPKILLVHKFNDEERFIGVISTTTQGTTYQILIWGTKVNAQFVQKGTLARTGGAFVYTGNETLATIGKTLILSDNSGMHYFLWTYDNNSDPLYEFLGDAFPRPNVQFKLGGRNDNMVSEQISCQGMLYMKGQHNDIFDIALNQQQNWNNAIVGLYSGLRKKLKQNKKFHGSFCVRAALELYDGSYYHIENPVFMLNHFSAYGAVRIYDVSLDLVTMEIYGQELRYKFSEDYTKWADIVKNVVLFVTREADIFETTVDAVCRPASWDSPSVPISYFMSGNKIYHDNTTTHSGPTSAGDLYKVLQSVPDSDLDDTIKSGVYYKLCEIGTTGDGDFHDASEHFNVHTLENLTTQDQLGDDDYYSHCPIKAGLLYSYNSRLNLANVWRGFFEGFNTFMPFDNDSESTYRALVSIQTDGGRVVIAHTYSTKEKQGIYFYYPDSRAKHVVIEKGNTQILNVNLTEHPALKGAYYFAGVSPDMVEPDSASGDIPSPTEGTPFEMLPNYILTSEVNNPFVFKAAGYYRVGTGKILAMSAVTTALANDQYSRSDLVVFSESGIWQLTVASTGYFSNIRTMSRDVLNNPKSIVQTDWAIFFTTEQGLMMLNTAGTQCVSEQMSGKTDAFAASLLAASNLGNFSEFLKNCFIAYDYRDRLLWIFNEGSPCCYIYSIKSGTFSKYAFAAITNIVNYYPDFLLQDSYHNIYTLTGRHDINSVEERANSYTASMLTRPMKLENGLALKKLIEIMHIKDMEGTLTIRLFASNNIKQDTNTWVELNPLLGSPWKYYRILYNFTGLKATDRFAGTVFITKEERINKLR